mmetsp:Transcript_1728/g.3558  ORF Transcript_1728/g.3558 Transcript_1728/m.3558 type:complete len:88 (-) Transcript_1728:842-1105(-)
MPGGGWDWTVSLHETARSFLRVPEVANETREGREHTNRKQDEEQTDERNGNEARGSKEDTERERESPLTEQTGTSLFSFALHLSQTS